MNKYKGIYRSDTTRLKNWDYRWDGAYFITICTNKKTPFLGEIKNGKMELSSIGEIAHQYYQEIPIHFPFALLDAFIIMPDHIHGIIIIDNASVVQTPKLGVSTLSPKLGISTLAPIKDASTLSPELISSSGAKKNWTPGSLGVIINQYKRICTISARKINPDFEWQPRFYDHIIRNNHAYSNIQNYIINNPANWPNDKLFDSSKKNKEK